MNFLLRATLCFAALAGMAGAASAQEWPPVEAHESTKARTEVVGGVPFTVGSFSYWLRLYRADRVSESKTNIRDSVEWHRVFGPETQSSPSSVREASRVKSPTPSLPPSPAPLPPLRLQNRPLPALKPLSSLPALASEASALPALPSLAPLSTSRPSTSRP